MQHVLDWTSEDLETGGEIIYQRSLPARYLHLIQEILINAIYQDRAMDPWSDPVFDSRKRDIGPRLAAAGAHDDRPRCVCDPCANVARSFLPRASSRRFRRDRYLARGGLHHDGGRARRHMKSVTAWSGDLIRSKVCRRPMRPNTPTIAAISFIGFRNWR